MELRQLLVGRSPRHVKIHCLMHAIGHDNLVGEGQPPWFHGMFGPEMHFLHLRIAMVGNRVAFRPCDAIAKNFPLHPFINGESRRCAGLRVLVILHNGVCSHGCGIRLSMQRRGGRGSNETTDLDEVQTCSGLGTKNGYLTSGTIVNSVEVRFCLSFCLLFCFATVVAVPHWHGGIVNGLIARSPIGKSEVMTCKSALHAFLDQV